MEFDPCYAYTNCLWCICRLPSFFQNGYQNKIWTVVCQKLSFRPWNTESHTLILCLRVGLCFSVFWVVKLNNLLSCCHLIIIGLFIVLFSINRPISFLRINYSMEIAAWKMLEDWLDESRWATVVPQASNATKSSSRSVPLQGAAKKRTTTKTPIS